MQGVRITSCWCSLQHDGSMHTSRHEWTYLERGHLMVVRPECWLAGSTTEWQPSTARFHCSTAGDSIRK